MTGAHLSSRAESRVAALNMAGFKGIPFKAEVIHTTPYVGEYGITQEEADAYERDNAVIQARIDFDALAKNQSSVSSFDGMEFWQPRKLLPAMVYEGLTRNFKEHFGDDVDVIYRPTYSQFEIRRLKPNEKPYRVPQEDPLTALLKVCRWRRYGDVKPEGRERTVQLLAIRVDRERLTIDSGHYAFDDEKMFDGELYFKPQPDDLWCYQSELIPDGVGEVE